MIPETLLERILWRFVIGCLIVGVIAVIICTVMILVSGEDANCRQTGIILIGTPPFPYPQFTCD